MDQAENEAVQVAARFVQGGERIVQDHMARLLRWVESNGLHTAGEILRKAATAGVEIGGGVTARLVDGLADQGVELSKPGRGHRGLVSKATMERALRGSRGATQALGHVLRAQGASPSLMNGEANGLTRSLDRSLKAFGVRAHVGMIDGIYSIVYDARDLPTINYAFQRYLEEHVARDASRRDGETEAPRREAHVEAAAAVPESERSRAAPRAGAGNPAAPDTPFPRQATALGGGPGGKGEAHFAANATEVLSRVAEIVAAAPKGSPAQAPKAAPSAKAAK